MVSSPIISVRVWRGKPRRRKFPLIQVLYPLLKGVLLAIPFLFPKGGWLIWGAMVPYLCQLFQLGGIGRICWISYLTGVGFWGAFFYWIAVFGVIPWVALVLYASLFWILFALLAYPFLKRPPLVQLFALPSLWVGLEWLRAQGTLGFTFGQIGSALYLYPFFLQPASYGGVWLLSALVFGANLSFALLLRDFREARFSSSALSFLGILLILLGACSLRMRGYSFLQEERPPLPRNFLRVGLLQGGINREINGYFREPERVFRLYEALTREAGKKGAQLILWPESSVPYEVRNFPEARERVARLARETRSALLVGSFYIDAQGRTFNTVLLFSPSGKILGEYRKHRPVPFGEFVPWRNWLPDISSLGAPLMDLSPGPGPEILGQGQIRIGPLICFESTFPDLALQTARRNPSLLVVATNDAWFGDSSARWQHLAFAPLRAVENGLPLVQCATDGVTAGYDAYGRQIDSLPVKKTAVLIIDLPLQNLPTLYRRWGDWMVLLAIGSYGLALLFLRISPPPLLGKARVRGQRRLR